MTAWVEGEVRHIPALRESNDILGDPAALEQRWDCDGYLFFRDVLDKNAVEELRHAYLEELEKFGVIEAGDDMGRYNGKDLGPLPKFPRGIQALFDRQVWRKFASNPSINRFVTEMLGEKPYWVPVVGYRVSPPGDPIENDRFVYVHQDSFFNKGIPFRNCWVPLTDMDSSIGGIAVAEGCHEEDYHSGSTPPTYPVRVHDVPMTAWRRSDYHPGDLLIMHLGLPHTGVSNVSSDRFRLSLDIRMLPSSGPLPTIGKIASIDPNQVTVEEEGGDRHHFIIDAETFCRALGPDRVPQEDIPRHLKPGDEIIVAGENGHAAVVRPASY